MALFVARVAVDQEVVRTQEVIAGFGRIAVTETTHARTTITE
jgi:hypothetical protein